MNKKLLAILALFLISTTIQATEIKVASPDGKAVVTVELLLKPLLSQMAEVALAKVQELEAADGD